MQGEEEQPKKSCDTASMISGNKKAILFHKKVSVLDLYGFLPKPERALTVDERNQAIQEQFVPELTQEELEQQEYLYCSRLSEELDRDCMKTYINSEAWK